MRAEQESKVAVHLIVVIPIFLRTTLTGRSRSIFKSHVLVEVRRPSVGERTFQVIDENGRARGDFSLRRVNSKRTRFDR